MRQGVEYIVEEERERTVSSGSEIAFYKNGVRQGEGAAFNNVWAEVYFPAASLYKAATIEFNFGPTFAFPPSGADARPVCELGTAPPGDADGMGAQNGADGGLFGNPHATVAAAVGAAGEGVGGDDDAAGDEGDEGEEFEMMDEA